MRVSRAAVGMLFAFTWDEYQIGGYAKGMTWEAFKHAVSISDVWSDIMHQFNPSYGTYVLHTDGGPEKNVKKKIFQGGAKKARGQQRESAYSQVGGSCEARGQTGCSMCCVRALGKEEEERLTPLARLLLRLRPCRMPRC